MVECSDNLQLKQRVQIGHHNHTATSYCFFYISEVISSVASRGQGELSAPSDSKNFAKNQEKEGKNRKQEGKSGEIGKKRKNREGKAKNLSFCPT